MVQSIYGLNECLLKFLKLFKNKKSCEDLDVSQKKAVFWPK